MFYTTLIEAMFSIALFVNAILFLPQLRLLYRHKDPQELSLVTFLGFNLIQLLTLLHGIIHDDNLLIYGMLLSLISCGSISVLIIYYRYLHRAK